MCVRILLKQIFFLQFVLKIYFYDEYSIVTVNEDILWPRDTERCSGSFAIILDSVYVRHFVITCYVFDREKGMMSMIKGNFY